MKKKHLILNGLVFLLLFACNSKESNYLNAWKMDKKACKGIRTVEKTQVLLTELKLESQTLESITATLGTPDRLTQSDESTYLEYYIENNCSSEEKEICLLTIGFLKAQRYPTVSITCS
ncbi:hypothetical protein [Flavobacterium sp. GCM10027622]|uniref:hypothetical protein n=1 Tax=unclassified Flavobacterium TaxID=196869 RepID=UPI00361C6913